MKILLLTKIDAGGAAWFLREALLQAGHEARQVRWRVNDFIGYPADIIQPSESRLRALWDWADILHVHDNAPFVPEAWWKESKPTIVTYHGSMYRDSPKRFDMEAERRGWFQTVATPDLTSLCPHWMPDSRPEYDRAEPYSGRGIFRISHAPTNRSKKGTDAILAALQDVRGIEIDVIENVSHSECIARKRASHLVIDQTTLGYGCNAIEAWAMGLPVIAGGDDRTLRHIEKYVGTIPFLVARTGRCILNHIIGLRDRQAYLSAVQIGRECFESHHSYFAASDRALQWYAEAMK